MIRLAESALIERNEAQRRREQRQHARKRKPRIRPAVHEHDGCAARVAGLDVVDAKTGAESSFVNRITRSSASA
jgi:hypothetical protein